MTITQISIATMKLYKSMTLKNMIGDLAKVKASRKTMKKTIILCLILIHKER
jgi:hypothetical protein